MRQSRYYDSSLTYVGIPPSYCAAADTTSVAPRSGRNHSRCEDVCYYIILAVNASSLRAAAVTRITIAASERGYTQVGLIVFEQVTYQHAI